MPCQQKPMNSGKLRIYHYDPKTTQINSLGIRDREMGDIVHFKPRGSASDSNQYLSVGERDILKLEFSFYGNDGIVLKVEYGWIKQGCIYLYCSKRKAIKRFICIQNDSLALGFTTLDLT